MSPAPFLGLSRGVGGTMAEPFLLKGANEICDLVRENPKHIKTLVEEEGFPAWKRKDTPKEPWRAHPDDIAKWAREQADKYRR